MHELIKYDLKKYADIAYDILNEPNTPLKRKKSIIKQLFKKQFDYSKEDLIYTRLSLIDSFYSTQMNKRRFGIENLTDEINKFDDAELINIIRNNSFNSQKFQSLISKTYGFKDIEIKQNDNKKKGSKALSLITKYLYFLTNYQFPIYDKFVKEFLSKYSNISKHKLNTCFECFLESINELNTKSGINNYEKLDNFLWLLGKVNEKSFSLILDEKEYKSYLKKDKKLEPYNRKLKLLIEFKEFVSTLNE